jgi:hypothetical protein
MSRGAITFDTLKRRAASLMSSGVETAVEHDRVLVQLVCDAMGIPDYQVAEVEAELRAIQEKIRQWELTRRPHAFL